MPKLRLPKSVRKWLRQEKARIRHEILDPKEADAKIRELVEQLHKKYHKDKTYEKP
jgi:hypothetical protein